MLHTLLLLLSLLNADRHAHGIAPLRLDHNLSRVAQWRSSDMRARHYFSHYIPPRHRLVFQVLDQRHIPYSTAGENIGQSGLPAVETLPHAMRDLNGLFMASPDHRANILDPAYTRVGVGLAVTNSGTIYVTEDFAG